MTDKEAIHVKPMGLIESGLLFGIPALLLYLLTHFLTPFLIVQGLNGYLAWFAAGGPVFVLLFTGAVVLYLRDGYPAFFSALKTRFRLKPLSRGDWGWVFLSLVIIMVLTGISMLVLKSRIPGFSPSPSFMPHQPLLPEQRWILLVWVVVFFFNIVGEELFWRGYILPRQEARFGRYAWFLNALLWTVFHCCFGLPLLIMLLPLLFIQTYVVARRRNTTIGILLHGIINGPSFVLISLGVIT